MKPLNDDNNFSNSIIICQKCGFQKGLNMEIKCVVCGKNATRCHARHDNGKLENLCEEHYAVWHPEWNSDKHGNV
jgi:hypothetical protein